jgi:AAA+ ATPase superfamily predicted ATPase
MRINAGGLSEIIIGRDRELKTLEAYLKLGQHSAIVAPRRYGKTTLVNAALEKLDRKKHFIIKLDVMSASSVRELCTQMIDAVYESHGVSNFFKQVRENVLDMLSRFNLDSEFVSIGYDILKEPDESEMLKKAFQLPELFAQKHNKKAVVFMDEFGEMDKFGQDVIKKMRSYFQLHAHVVYIFAGSQTSMMNQIFLNKDNAFFNFASIMRLGLIADRDMIEFLEDVQIDDLTLSEAAINKITAMSKGHPFYMMKLLQEAFIVNLIADSGDIIHEGDVDAALTKILSDNDPLFASEWDRINSKKHKGRTLKELLNINHGDNTPINASYKSQMIRELKDDSILANDKTMVDPLFELWLVRRF